ENPTRNTGRSHLVRLLVVIHPKVSLIASCRCEAYPRNNRRKAAIGILKGESRKSVQREEHVSLAWDQCTTEGRIEEIFLPDPDREKLTRCVTTIGGRATREKPVRNRVFDL